MGLLRIFYDLLPRQIGNKIVIDCQNEWFAHICSFLWQYYQKRKLYLMQMIIKAKKTDVIEDSVKILIETYIFYT